MGERNRQVQLSPREREVVELLGEGNSLGYTAAKLRISKKSVITYRTTAKIKMGLGPDTSNEDMMTRARELGLIES